MDDLLPDFVAECSDMLSTLGGEVVAWEADPGDRARLDSIFRFVHTVKGNCGFFDFPRLEALSHAAEGALAEVRAGRRQADSGLVSAVLAVLDRIGEMIAAIDAQTEFPAGGDEALIASLDAGAEAIGATGKAESMPAIEGPARPQAPQRTIRLSVDLLDRVMSGVSDMVLARNDLARRLREADVEAGTEGAFDRLSAIIADMQDAITRTRMQRIDSLFSPLSRLVRDLSAELGKQVLVDIDSGEVELDREMIEMIRDPLTHIVRNAIDHGIEAVAERRAAGKREIGLLSVSARQSGNQIVICIGDDGRGIDGARLVEKAIAAGLLEPDRASRLKHGERCALIFEPGLSTASAVTAISGRGVGMDVVRSNVERIGGVVEIDSTPGQGTRITMRVPLTLTIISALTVSIGRQQFAIPRSAIEEVVQASASQVEFAQAGDATLAIIRGQRIPCVALAPLLGCESAVREADRMLVVLRPSGNNLLALAVDRIHDHEELVVKPAAPAIMAAGIYAGVTLAGDGSPILLLDAVGLAHAGRVHFEARERVASLDTAIELAVQAPVRQVLLFIGRDGQRRAMPIAAVDRVEEASADTVEFSAGQTRIVVEDRIIPLAGMGGEPLSAGTVRFLRLCDGERELGYALREVIDLVAIEGEVIAAEAPGEIAGVALIGGEQAEVIDPHWLFASLTGQAAQVVQRVCRIPSNDPWMQSFLRPLVEAAGYRVVDEADAAKADLAIAASDDTGPRLEGAEVIRLRASPDEQTDGEGSIYRYDRAELMFALKATSARKAS